MTSDLHQRGRALRGLLNLGIASVLVSAACGDNPGAHQGGTGAVVADGVSFSGSNANGGASGGTDSPLPESGGFSQSCKLVNETRACLCGTLPGRQTCVGREWTACECFDTDAVAVDQGGQISGDGGSGEEYENEGNKRGDISFDWVRTVPLEGECKPGRYEGSFECTTNGPLGDIMPEILVTGPVVMTLEKSLNGEFLEIVDGSLEGLAQEFAVPFTSELEGQLDCTTNKFEAFAVDGTYLLFVLEGKFHGDLTGDYNRLTSHLSGQWSLSDDLNDNLTCVGPWTADLVDQ
jgi:hypothetical protein